MKTLDMGNQNANNQFMDMARGSETALNFGEDENTLDHLKVGDLEALSGLSVGGSRYIHEAGGLWTRCSGGFQVSPHPGCMKRDSFTVLAGAISTLLDEC